MTSGLPYKIAVLCYLYDERGRLLLLHRAQSPNLGMCSPIGGKLALDRGESPHDCALREIREEAGVTLRPEDIHLAGMVAETAYEGQTHWLLFVFEVQRPIPAGDVTQMQINEGTLEWVDVDDVPARDIPETDRKILWPLVQTHRGGGFFVVHIDCGGGELTWTVQESRKARAAGGGDPAGRARDNPAGRGRPYAP